MKSKKMPRIKKKIGYKLRMITISVSLTTTKLVVPELCYLFIFLVSRSHGSFHSTESICGTWYHRIKTCMEHAEPQHPPPSPGGVVALEKPIRGGRGYQWNENPKSRLCFGLGLLVIWISFSLACPGSRRKPRDWRGSGQHREDPFGGRAQHV